MTNKISSLVVVLVLALSSHALASELTCSDLVKKCFADEGVKKSNCFYRASVDKVCEDTESGKLAHKRWMLSGASTTHGTQAFLGPLGVDNSCANSCDNQWLAFLIADEPVQAITEHINRCLDACKSGNAVELPSL